MDLRRGIPASFFHPVDPVKIHLCEADVLFCHRFPVNHGVTRYRGLRFAHPRLFSHNPFRVNKMEPCYAWLCDCEIPQGF